MDKYRIDSHKLLYHVPRVNAWLQEENIYPIYVEISPSGSCNHRCTYCALDFMEYRNRYLDAALLGRRLSEMGRLGVKSVMYAGEGEPLLHKDIAGIVAATKRAGIDVGITTNGVLLKEDLAQKLLPQVEWIKVSINGASAATYAAVHRTRPADFRRVIENMERAAKIKHGKGYRCTLGMQLLLLPENWREARPLAELARDIGMDYLVIKPYSQHPQSKTEKYKNIRYADYSHLADALAEYNDERFSLIFRINSMRKWDDGRPGYERCLALPFWAYLDSGGNIWGCSVYLGDEKFYYGNIYQNCFREIWEGEKRLSSLAWVQRELDACRCRVNCRMDEINRYLWELRNPGEHVNFI